MAAKTSKDDALDAGGPEESEAAGADATVADETEAVETTAKPAARRKRRVRVIEVLDDEDIDEVLDAMDAEEEAAAEEEAEKPAPKPKAKPAAKTTTAKSATAKSATTKAAPAKKKPEIIEAEESEDDEAVEVDDDEAKPVRKPSASDDGAGGAGGGSYDRRIGGVPLVPAVVGVVVIALLASLAIWQWSKAGDLSSKNDARAEVAKVASAYGDVAVNYNASNYQSQMEKAQSMMAGDLLDNFKRCTLPNLGATFKSSPNLALSSKTTQTFVNSVDGRFATAVVSVTVGFKSDQGSSEVPANLIRLSLAKQDGKWKVTQQYASGVNAMSQDCGQSQLPGTNGQTPGNGKPSGSPSPTPKPSN